MLEYLRKLSDDQKRYLALGAAVLAVCLALLVLAMQLMGRDPAAASRTRTLIDAATGEVFVDFAIPDNATTPYENPDTGERTLYPAEKCFWTADGRAKLEPTYVLVNEYIGKEGPTLCPDCGRRVVPHNPLPPDELLLAAAREEQ